MNHQKFYHGTSIEARAQKILQEGIRPDLSTTEGLARPVAGCVYLSLNLRYSIIYLLGGDMLGSTLPESWLAESRYGYLFMVSGESLGVINPDEDQVGQAISEGKFQWVKYYQDFLRTQDPLICEEETEDAPNFYSNLWEQVNDGDYSAWIKAGHLLLPRLEENEKQDIMLTYGNVANKGVVNPIMAWKFDKLKCSLLQADGSNFFELAEQVL